MLEYLPTFFLLLLFVPIVYFPTRLFFSRIFRMMKAGNGGRIHPQDDE